MFTWFPPLFQLSNFCHENEIIRLNDHVSIFEIFVVGKKGLKVHNLWQLGYNSITSLVVEELVHVLLTGLEKDHAEVSLKPKFRNIRGSDFAKIFFSLNASYTLQLLVLFN